MKRFAIALFLGLSVGTGSVFPCIALADDSTRPSATDATRPSATDASRARPGPLYVVRRFKQVLGKLTLTDDQKPKVSAILNQATDDANTLAQKFMDIDNPQERGTQLKEFAGKIRDQLAGVLNDDQMSALNTTFMKETGTGGDSARSPARIMGALQTALEQLELTDDQKSQVKDLIKTTQQKLAAIHSKGGDDVASQIQQVRQEARKQLGNILQPEQLQKLQELMKSQRGPGKEDGKNPPAEKESSQATPTTGPVAADLKTEGPAVGDPAPSVKILEMNGRLFDPASYRGHVIVLEFGSITSPVFRDQVQAMNQLKNAEGPRAFFMLVYQREAFPSDKPGVARNRDANIAQTDPTNLEARKALAARTQKELKITLPMAVDSMDDAAAHAFGVGANSTIVIGKDGTIAGRQQWTNATSLRRMIDDANQK